MSSNSRRKRKSPRPATTAASLPVTAPEPSKARPDWKDHPVIVAGGSAAAGFGLSLAFFTGIVMPNQSAKLENEIRQRKDNEAKQAQLIERKDAQLRKLGTELSKASQSLATAANELYQSRFRNLFTRDSPYPNGVSSVHVGMPMTVLETAYPEAYRNRDPEEDWIEVDIQNSPIRSAVFYYHREKGKEGKETVGQILFFFGNDKHPRGLLQKLLISTYGLPTLISKNKKHYAWNVNTEANIFYRVGEDSFVVSKKEVIPGSWPIDE